MLIVSQNLSNYDIPIPKNAIYRINLAWINDLNELNLIVKKNHSHDIFLDLPKGRIKPPNNKYSIEDILPIIKSNSNIKYLAISNVEDANDVLKFTNIVPDHTSIVPKIESRNGIKKIQEIVAELNEEKVVMLDHNDLYSEILRSGGNPKEFTDYIQKLVEFCSENDVKLLRTIGVMFADTEKRISEYVN